MDEIMLVWKSGKWPTLRKLARVQHPEIYAPSGKAVVVGGIPMQFERPTGKRDRKRIQIIAEHAQMTFPMDRTEIHKNIRKLRQQEAEQIAAIDAEIKALQAARSDLLLRAWQNGNTLTLKELTDRIQE